jgi:hypothetical protein
LHLMAMKYRYKDLTAQKKFEFFLVQLDTAIHCNIAISTHVVVHSIKKRM